MLRKPDQLQLQPNDANPPVSVEIWIPPDIHNFILEQHVATISWNVFEPEPFRI